MKRSILLAITALTLFSCSKGGNNDATPTKPTSASVTINGTDYPIVKISSKTWTSSNYNGTGGVNYAFSATNNATYGKLYTLAEAKAVILPTGWRLPTKQDFLDLMNAAGTTTTDKYGEILIDGTASSKLRSPSVWSNVNGTNSLGFTAYPVGVSSYITLYTPAKPDQSGFGTYTAFWSSDGTADTQVTGRTYKNQYTFSISNQKLSDNTTEDIAILNLGSFVDEEYYSLRFVKDN